MAVTKPKFIAATSVATAGFQATTTPKETEGSLTTAIGDIVVAVAWMDESTGTANLNTPTGLGLTFTLQQRVAVKENTEVAIWTAKATEVKTGKVSFSRGAIANKYGGAAYQFRESGGIGIATKTNGSGEPSLGITTEKENSAIVMAIGDWEAKKGTVEHTYREGAGAFTEETNRFQEGVYMYYGGFYPSASAPGAKTVGMTKPTGQKYSIIAVEVLGEEAGGGPFTAVAPQAGAEAGGLAPTLRITAPAPQAGAEAGGLAPTPNVRPQPPQGGAEAGGVAPTPNVRPQPPQGGAEAGGLAPAPKIRLQPPQAAAEAGGVVPAVRLTLRPPQAGAEAAGLAPTPKIRLQPPQGAAEAGGEAPSIAFGQITPQTGMPSTVALRSLESALGLRILGSLVALEGTPATLVALTATPATSVALHSNASQVSLQARGGSVTLL